jgi:hypothetical protein
MGNDSMAELKNVVIDINAMVDRLSDGIDITESLEPHIDKFVADIEEAVRHWAKPQDLTRRDGLRMSNIGKPSRQLYYDMRADPDAPRERMPQVKFLYGHIVEALVLLLVKSAGHTVENEQKEVNVEGIKGHMDCTIDGEVVDVKSASPFGFKKFVNGTVPEDDPFGYMAQIAGYEKAEGTSNGGNLVMDKVTGELCLFIPEDLDKPNILERIKEVKLLETLDKPPELCYPDEQEGKKGNMIINRKCNWCPHIEECRGYSNDGRGIRKYRYSTGTKYFTEVFNEPRVEEII